jgi:hypothetical protein
VGGGIAALISKIRSLLEPVAGSGGQALIRAALGCHQLHLPDGSWVDLEAAGAAVHAAETALAHRADGHGRERGAGRQHDQPPAATGRRQRPMGRRSAPVALDVRVRALECLSEVWRRKGDSGQAARDAEMVLRLDPHRETALPTADAGACRIRQPGQRPAGS